MKVLILSVRPQHAYNILNGEKTLELRKSVPKGFKGWVYVYVTKAIRDYKQSYYYQPKGKEEIFRLHGIIPCRFWFDEYDDIVYTIKNEYVGCNGKELSDWAIGSFYLDKLQLTYKDILYYGKGKDLYAWHIKNLEIFDKPMQLSDFAKPRKSMKQENKYWIHKAPQSYMYAWVKEEMK